MSSTSTIPQIRGSMAGPREPGHKPSLAHLPITLCRRKNRCSRTSFSWIKKRDLRHPPHPHPQSENNETPPINEDRICGAALRELRLDRNENTTSDYYSGSSSYTTSSTCSGTKTRSNSDDPADLEDREEALSSQGWTSDFEPEDNLLTFDSKSEFDFKRDTRRRRTFSHLNVIVSIPEANLSGVNKDQFFLEIIEDHSLTPPIDCRRRHISKIISVGPHGAQFDARLPAYITIPLVGKIDLKVDRVKCLCSNTTKDQPPLWETMATSSFKLKGTSSVIIKAFHFSLFTIVSDSEHPEVRETVRHYGTVLKVAGVPGVEVHFPRNVIGAKAVDAFCRVLYDKEPESKPQTPLPEERALASPIISCGPHGYTFTGSGPVVVQLPIPHYNEIYCKHFGPSQPPVLTAWQSSTTDNEPLSWEQLAVEIALDFKSCPGLVVARFPVNHFSFFKVVWNLLSSTLTASRLGVSFFYPLGSFAMMCGAWMGESNDNKKFGLEVILYRADKERPEESNYKYRVGRSLKSKQIKPGVIVIKLKSELFEADTQAGEDPSLTKFEVDFRGNDFEKQFACRFKDAKPAIDRGSFGKLLVERQINEKTRESLFEFNLHKANDEEDPHSMESVTSWSIVPLKNLASSLEIIDDLNHSNWKIFARHIGFTKNEIQRKLSYAEDPFNAMVLLYQERGGTADEFVSALYQVKRNISIGENGGKTSVNQSPTGSSHSQNESTASGSKEGRRVAKKGFSPINNLPATPTKWRGNSDSNGSELRTETTNLSSNSSRKRSHLNANFKKPRKAAKKRRRVQTSNRRLSRKTIFSGSETSITETTKESSSSDEDRMDEDEEGEGERPEDDEDEDEEEEEEHQMMEAENKKLKSQDLWEISTHMNTINWRALGRTLGLEESVLINIEHAYKSTGFRECAYQMLLEWKERRPQQCTFGSLRTALCKEKMNSIAKNLDSLKIDSCSSSGIGSTGSIKRGNRSKNVGLSNGNKNKAIKPFKATKPAAVT